MLDLSTLAITFVSAGGVAGTIAILRIPADKRKANADTASQLTTGAMDQARSAWARADNLQARLDAVETRIDSLERELGSAQDLLRSALAFIERLLSYIADHLPAVTDVPTIPGDLRDHMTKTDRKDQP